MNGPRAGSDFDDLANDYREAPDYEHPSRYDPYYLQRADERKKAMKDKLKAKSGKNPSRAKQQREPVTSIDKVLSDRGRKNSRTKGNRAELDVAQMFSRWCGNTVRRTPMSGGWSSARFGVTADLVCPKKAFPFHVEVKHREGWTLDDLVTGVRTDHDKSIVQWWQQCVGACPVHRREGDFGVEVVRLKEPLLVFRRNRQPWLVMFESRRAYPPVGEFSIQVVAMGTIVMRLDRFLAHEPVPKGLKNYARDR